MNDNEKVFQKECEEMIKRHSDPILEDKPKLEIKKNKKEEKKVDDGE